ncbi:amidase signature domain-containing protein [Bisporella sp. PMI_857]|nr:amidase signature domain-containing protein [Bisporella sp. PMI_857]
MLTHMIMAILFRKPLRFVFKVVCGQSSPFAIQIFLLAIIMGFFVSLLCKACVWRKRAQNIPSGSPFTGFDPLLATATELQNLLSSGALTSVDLVNQGFAQIERYDDYLRAIISVSPTALEDARRLDRERVSGRIRGPLHGIPMLIKDNVATSLELGMDTTAGSFALQDSRPLANADIVNKLVEAGVIIIAKSQLSEFANYKGSGLPPGWSAIRGQCQSAYTSDDFDLDDLGFGHSVSSLFTFLYKLLNCYNYQSPGGSSTGSAVGVSAGYASIGLGTDTTGSVVIPATRAGLYSIRLTTGITSMEGIVPFSRKFDTVGPLAKGARDIANILDVIVDRGATNVPLGGYASVLHGKWDHLKIGTLSPEKWFIPPSLGRPNPAAREQMDRETREAYRKMQNLGATVKSVELVSWEEMSPANGKGIFDLFEADFRKDIESYLKVLPSSSIKTLDDIIKFNIEHASLELPKGYESQDLLIRAANNSMSTEAYEKTFAQMRLVSRDMGIDKTLRTDEVDVIIGPADSAFSLLACGAGYPSATLPLSYLDFNGRPFGLFALTTAHHEDTLLQVMSAWESTFPARKPPSMQPSRLKA